MSTEIDYGKFKKALKLLEEQNNRLNSEVGSMEEWVIDAVKESTIQRFETCWDCLWKVLKRYLEIEIGLAEVPNGPNPILRLANENSVLTSSIEDWLMYARVRVGTSHDYSGVKATDALKCMSSFIDDAVKLYEKMSGESWR